ncbi:MAG: alpha-N-acetylglucosaminidase [Clostridia bacterium]|nr:alpha-N-acetylglucosaminidase [Clostridia bacterium]
MQAIKGLIKRIVPELDGMFDFEIIEKQNGKEVFELDSKNGRPVLRGDSQLSIAAALGYYVKKYLKFNISWCGNRTQRIDKAPLPEFYHREIEQTYRTYMNYCTHSYSCAWWDWRRWEREIDMMALNGINMPLAVTGVEAVWYKTLLELGFSDLESRSFLAGPGFLAWQWMTNLEGHGGPLPKSWIDCHEELGKKILNRELEFGMKPIQQGFSGFVPMLAKEKFPEANILVKKTWNNIGTTAEVDPTDPLFDKIGSVFFEKLRETFGLHGFYAADPFHEGFPPKEGKEYLNEVAHKISGLFQRFDPDHIWVMQSWSLRKDILTAIDKDKVLVLDLLGNMPDDTNGFYGYNFVSANLHNFGARMALHGDLPLQASNKFMTVKEKYPNVCGTGIMMEGIGQNPVFYDLCLEMLCYDKKVDLKAWLKDYTERRYGVKDKNAEKAFEILLDKVYCEKTDFVERGSLICSRPSVALQGTGPMDDFFVHYPESTLAEVLELLLKVDSDSDGYKYDVADVTRQMMSNYALSLYTRVAESFKAKNKETFKALSAELLELIEDFDKLLSFRPEWTIQKWIADARSHGKTQEESDLYEYNARMQVTLWGNEQASLLFDYAWKEWSGLVGGYYAVRWQKFLKMLEEKLEKGEEYSEDNLEIIERRFSWRANAFYSDLADWESKWVHSTEPIPLKNADFGFIREILGKYKAKVLSHSKEVGEAPEQFLKGQFE